MRRFQVLLAIVYAVVLVLGMAAPARSQSAPLPVLPITQLDTRGADPDLDGRRLPLTFPRPASVRDILMRLVRNTRLSVIADPSVKAR